MKKALIHNYVFKIHTSMMHLKNSITAPLHCNKYKLLLLLQLL